MADDDSMSLAIMITAEAIVLSATFAGLVRKRQFLATLMRPPH
ncbi:MAG: hypothetical protein AB8G26_09075 [Ilumatobacter sp.]